MPAASRAPKGPRARTIWSSDSPSTSSIHRPTRSRCCSAPEHLHDMRVADPGEPPGFLEDTVVCRAGGAAVRVQQLELPRGDAGRCRTRGARRTTRRCRSDRAAPGGPTVARPAPRRRACRRARGCCGTARRCSRPGASAGSAGDREAPPRLPAAASRSAGHRRWRPRARRARASGLNVHLLGEAHQRPGDRHSRRVGGGLAVRGRDLLITLLHLYSCLDDLAALPAAAGRAPPRSAPAPGSRSLLRAETRPVRPADPHPRVRRLPDIDSRASPRRARG